MAWDAALADALLSGPAADTEASGRPSSAGSRCRIRGCTTALTAGYSQRAKCVRPPSCATEVVAAMPTARYADARQPSC